MKDNASRRGLKLITWALMLTPLLLLVVFFSLMIHLWIALGHWPTPSNQDYRPAIFLMHERFVTWFGRFTIWGAIPIWLGLVCIQRFHWSWSMKLHVVQALVFVAGWGAIVGFAAWNPGKVMNWYFD